MEHSGNLAFGNVFIPQLPEKGLLCARGQLVVHSVPSCSLFIIHFHPLLLGLTLSLSLEHYGVSYGYTSVHLR